MGLAKEGRDYNAEAGASRYFGRRFSWNGKGGGNGAVDFSYTNHGSAVNLSEGEKQKRINESNGRAAEIRLLAEASAEGVRLVAEAIQAPGGDQAVKMNLTEQFIGELGSAQRIGLSTRF